jgi:hypothetical protein
MLRLKPLALLVGLFVGTAASPTYADDQPWLRLLRDDSLAGWEHGGQIDAWKVQNGVLHGEHGTSPLLGGWTAGDFELRFTWTVKDGGQLKLLLHPLPGGQPIECRLSEDELCGRLVEGDKLHFVGAKATSGGQPHPSVLTRSGEKLTLTVDQHKVFEVSLPSDRRFGFGLAVHEGAGSIGELAIREPLGEPIFNGRDLDGWWTPGNLKSWGVEDGQIVCLNKNGNYLRTEKSFGNFTLSFNYKTARGVNSGIGIRTPRNGWPSGDGMELQIYDHAGLDKHSTMSLYGNCEPLGRADRSTEWNHCVIKADGRMISAWVNGQLVQHVNTATLPELKHRHLQGWIGIQDHGGRIWLRDMKVLEAPPGLGLDAWYTKRPEPAPLVILDRLMNSQRLAAPDGLQAEMVAQSIPQKGTAIILDAKGPGALVRLSHTGSRDKLQFYFDDEEQPRLEADTSNLRTALPAACEDSEPLLTCVPYGKRLRIALEAGGPGRYELATVRFPASQPVESFVDARASIPRGLLSALDYKHHQLSWGTHREYDPYDRVSTSPKVLMPGQSGLMMSLDAAGVVLWTKLHANPKVLDNDDLWIEVRADGQLEPLIAAPARFFFPALRGGQNHTSFLFTQREGMTCLLAMPFSLGLQITAVNHGRDAIPGIHMTCSVDRSAAAAETARSAMRLCGRFTGAGESKNGESKKIIAQSGRGRWVGLVYEPTSSDSPTSTHLVVDGKSSPGWMAQTLDQFLGRRGKEPFFTALSGQSAGLAWRYLLLEPIGFNESISLESSAPGLGSRLALFYLQPKQ